MPEASDHRQQYGDKIRHGMFVHPMPHIERRGGHHRVDGVPKGPLEVVPYHPVV